MPIESLHDPGSPCLLIGAFCREMGSNGVEPFPCRMAPPAELVVKHPWARSPLALSLAALLAPAPALAQLSWRIIPAPRSALQQQPQPGAAARSPRPSSTARALPSAQATQTVAATPTIPSDGSVSAASSRPLLTAATVAPGRANASAPAQVPIPGPSAPATAGGAEGLRRTLRIPPLVKRERPWPAPSLSPGVPSAFIANWGDVFFGASTATRQARDVVDGSWNAGFGLGNASKAVALEISGGCGSINRFCGNGSFSTRISRLLISRANARVAIAGAWQNFAQWGYEGRQDNIYYGAFTYALPLRQDNRRFGQTLQFNAGVGNSLYAPYTPENSQSKVGGFASLGVELSPAVGVSAGWSGRGANAQLSYTPFRNTPITLSVLGADLLNQTPGGAIGVFTVSWGTNFTTPSFD